MSAIWQVLRRSSIRHLRDRPGRTLLTVGGIAAGVCLVVTISVINATLRESIDATASGLAGDADLEVAPAGDRGLSDRVVSDVGDAGVVEAAVPYVRVITRVRGAERQGPPVQIFGVTRGLRHLFPKGLGRIERQLASLGPGVLLSERLAERLGERRRLRVQTPDGYRTIRVAGRVKRGPFESLNGGEFALMSMSHARRVFDRGTDGLYVTASEGTTRNELRRTLKREVDGAGVVRSPTGGAQSQRRTFDAIASTSEQSGYIALFVAFFAVLNTMSMAVAERRRELGIMVSIGTPREALAGAFLAEAAVLGVVGTLVGAGAGVVLARALVERVLEAYPLLPITAGGSVTITPAALVVGLAGGPLVAVLGAALPARRILRAVPIETLRPEAAYEWRPAGRRLWQVVTLPAGIVAVGLGLALILLGSSAEDFYTTLSTIGLVTWLAGVALLLPWIVPLLARVVRALSLRASPVLGRLAGDNVMKNPGRASLSAGGLAIAATLALSVGTSLDSFESELETAAQGWYRAPLYVSADATPLPALQPLPPGYGRELARVRGVKAAYPFTFGSLDYRGRQMLIYAFSFGQMTRNGDDVARIAGVSRRRALARLRRGQIVVSRYTARHLGLKAGDTINLPTPRGKRTLRIGALFNDFLTTLDSFYIERSRYRELWRDSTVDHFAVVPAAGVSPTVLERRLTQFVDRGPPVRRRSAQPRAQAQVVTRDEKRAFALDPVRGAFAIARAIQVATLLLAALIVANTMLTATFERRFELGVQRMLGMDRPSIARSIVLEAGIIGAVGAVIALATGLGVGYLATFPIEDQIAWKIGFSVPAGLVVATVVATVVVGILAALYPSYRAARVKVIEALHHD